MLICVFVCAYCILHFAFFCTFVHNDWSSRLTDWCLESRLWTIRSFTLPKRWFFGKVSNSIWPPPIALTTNGVDFRQKVDIYVLDIFNIFAWSNIASICKKIWKNFVASELPPPLELFWKCIRFGRVRLPEMYKRLLMAAPGVFLICILVAGVTWEPQNVTFVFSKIYLFVVFLWFVIWRILGTTTCPFCKN